MDDGGRPEYLPARLLAAAAAFHAACDSFGGFFRSYPAIVVPSPWDDRGACVAAFPRAPTSSSSSHERSSRSRKRPPRRRPATHALRAKAPSTVQKMPALVAASRIVAPAQLKARAAPARRVVAVHAVASAKCVLLSSSRASLGVPAPRRALACTALLGPDRTPRCRLSTSDVAAPSSFKPRPPLR